MKEEYFPIQDSKEYLKYQLFNLLQEMPKRYQNTKILCYIVEELLADILCFSANENQVAQLLLTDAYYQIKTRINELASK